MLGLGYGFAFIGNQYRIVANGNEYFIDLLFYNCRLQCLVAIELLCDALPNSSRAINLLRLRWENNKSR